MTWTPLEYSDIGVSAARLLSLIESEAGHFEKNRARGIAIIELHNAGNEKQWWRERQVDPIANAAQLW